MSINYQDLLHPENLSESALRDILKNKCIDISNLMTMNKSNLIKMYKRIALPMPQRQINEGRHLGKKLNNLRISRNIPIAANNEQTVYHNNLTNKRTVESFENSIRIPTQLSKKIRLSNSCDEINGTIETSLINSKTNERKIDEETESNKRRKIN